MQHDSGNFPLLRINWKNYCFDNRLQLGRQRKQQHLQNFARISPRISTRLQILQMVLTWSNMYYRSLYFISIRNGPHHFTNLTQAASGVELCHRPVMARGTAWSQGAIPQSRLARLLVDWLVPRTVNFLESSLPTWYQTVHYRPCSHARHQEICVTTAAASTCARSWHVFPMWEDEWIGVIILPEKGSNDSTNPRLSCLYNLIQHFRIATYKIIQFYNTRQLRQKVRT